MRKEQDLKPYDLEKDLEEEASDAPETKQVEEDGLTVLAKMLPGISRTTNSLVRIQDLRRHYACINVGYSEAMRRIRTLEASLSAEQKETRAALIIGVKKESLIALTQLDALEEARKRLNLDELRDQLVKNVRNQISASDGFEFLRTFLELQGHGLLSDQEILNIFPNLTVAEIALLPLFVELPSLYLSHSTSIDLDTENSKSFALRRKRIPQLLYATPTGVAITLDDQTCADEFAYDVDVYQSLGLTGIRQGEESVEFSSYVAKSLRALFPLILTNSQLFDAVWDEAHDGVQIALGKIDLFCIQRTMGEVNFDPLVNSFQTALDSLPKQERIAVETQIQKIHQNIIESVIFSVQKGQILNATDKFKLIGILAELPHFLVEDKPISCLFLPYGAAIRFLSNEGEVLDQIPLDQVYGRNAIEELHWVGEDGSRDNVVAQNLFSMLRREVTDLTFTRYQEDQLLSVAEKVSLDLWLSRGVALEVVGSYELKQQRAWYTYSSSSYKVETSKKIGQEEAQILARTLRILPAEMLNRVERLRKAWQNSRTYMDYLNDSQTLGHYDLKEKRITLIENKEFLFPDSSGIERIILCFTLIHEVGEAVWTTLSEEKIAAWTKISWPKKKNQEICKHFLTQYSHTENQKEDFCEHFAAYVLHGAEFKQKGRDAKPLHRKYQFLRSIFSGFIGQDLQYQGTSNSIEYLHGLLELEKKRRALEEAVTLHELDDETAHEKAKKNWESIRQDIDELRAEFDCDPEDEEQAVDESREDDWEQIDLFIEGGMEGLSFDSAPGGSARDTESDTYPASIFRQKLVRCLQANLPANSGKLYKLAVRVSAALLYGTEDELQDELNVIRKKRKRQSVIQELKQIRDNSDLN